MAAEPEYEPVTIDWNKAGKAWEVRTAILHNFQGRVFCDTEIFGKYDLQTGNRTDEGGVARSVFQAFASSVQLAVASKQWTHSQRVDELYNGMGIHTAQVDTFVSSDGDRIEHWIPTEEAEEDNCCLLQTKGGLVLVAGCAVGHPYVACNLFDFGNSDGSTDALSFDVSSADALVQSLIKISETYAYNQVH